MKIALPMVSLIVALASTSVAAPWLDLSRDAPLQAVVRCEARSSHWEGGSIYSDSEVDVLRVVRGSPVSGITVRQRGGEVDGIGQKISHGTLLQPGNTYLLFLVPDELGRWSPVATGVNPVVDLPGVGQSIAGESLDEIVAALGGGN